MNNPMPFERMRAPTLDELNAAFDGYYFSDLIAIGGMGAVYKATQESLDRDVAVKVLPRRYAKNDDFVKAFNAEAKVLAKLNHPNLVKIYDFGVSEGMLYLVMEYIDGENLQSFIQRGLLDSKATAKITYEVAQGLNEAHKKGIVHRDIKPGNILIQPDLGVKVIDFGISKTAGFTKASKNIYGTLGYAAPEVTQQPELIDQRTDIYALGALMCYCSTGYTPDILIKEGIHNKGLLAELYPIVFKAIRTKKENRYANAKELANQLSSFLSRKDIKSFDFDKLESSRKTQIFPEATTKIVGVTTALYQQQTQVAKQQHSDVLVDNRYALREVIAERRIGTLYRAYDNTLEREVALTTISKPNTFTWGQGFLSITSDMAQINHPNIPNLLGTGLYKDGAYIVQQLLKGETLFKLMRKKVFSFEEVHDFTTQLLDTLQTASFYGFHNYAISPHSILVEAKAVKGYRFFLTDSGHGRITTLLHQHFGEGALETIVNTALLAPEIIENNPQGEISSIYMVGQLCYSLLASGHPYADKTIEEAYELHKSGQLPDISNYRKGVPEDFREWLKKCIQVSLSQRFQSLVDALNHLPKNKNIS